MNRDKVKLIVRNMELLVRALKEEIGDSPKLKYEETTPNLNHYEPDYYEEED
jgi:hypothetical protein